MAFIVDKKVKRQGNAFEWNPFTFNENELIGLNQSFRNSLFFNKGKQRNSITYNYTSNSVKNLLNFGNQENYLRQHQIQYAHLVKKFWLVQFIAGSGNSESKSDNYASRNFELHTLDWQPKVSSLFSKNASWELFYKNTTKNNTTGNFNVAVGAASLNSNSTGDENTAIGRRAMNNNTTGTFNTAIGQAALYANTNGSNNTGVGQAVLATNTTGNNNTAIGFYADVASNNLTNATAIGNRAIVTASNTIQLGNSSVTDVKTTGVVTASGFKTYSGTSSQYLMADGSVS